MTKEELNGVKEQICDVCHKCGSQGWVAANDGKYPFVWRRHILATPTGISKSYITPDKLVRMTAWDRYWRQKKVINRLLRLKCTFAAIRSVTT